MTRSARVSTGRARHVDDDDAFFGEAIDLPPDAVELAVGCDDARMGARRGSADNQRVTSSCVFCPSAMFSALSPTRRAKPARTAAAWTAARSHLSSTNSAASSQARCCALEPDVRPRLVRVACEQQPLTDSKSRVVPREGILCQSSVSSPRSPVSSLQSCFPNPESRVPSESRVPCRVTLPEHPGGIMNAAICRRLLLSALLLATSIPVAAQVRIIQTNSQGNNIHLIDPATNQIVGEVTGVPINHGAAGAPDGSRLYFSSEAEQSLHVVDGKTLQLTKKIPLSGRPNNISISRDGRKVYVGIVSSPGAVDVIDTGTLEQVKSIPTKGGIHNVYVTPDGKYVVAGSIAGKLMTVIDQKTEEPAWTLFQEGRSSDGVRNERRRIDEANLRPALRLPWLRGRGLRAAQRGRAGSSCRTTCRRRRWTRVRSTHRRRTASVSRQMARRCG